MNETLQLHRLAHEGIGHGDWTKCDRNVPITSSPLAVLDVSDATHPKLKASSWVTGNTKVTEKLGSESQNGTYHVLTIYLMTNKTLLLIVKNPFERSSSRRESTASLESEDLEMPYQPGVQYETLPRPIAEEVPQTAEYPRLSITHIDHSLDIDFT
jgi:hypothetical protein